MPEHAAGPQATTGAAAAVVVAAVVAAAGNGSDAGPGGAAAAAAAVAVDAASRTIRTGGTDVGAKRRAGSASEAWRGIYRETVGARTLRGAEVKNWRRSPRGESAKGRYSRPKFSVQKKCTDEGERQAVAKSEKR